jgi:AbrB family looped-hinge helix DNA binding protein
MTLKIDSAGRIVVPKPLRERLGLRAGMDLEVGESGDCLTLKPVSEKPAMVREKGFWVHQGAAPRDFDWDRLIEEEREEHSRKVWGK